MGDVNDKVYYLLLSFSFCGLELRQSLQKPMFEVEQSAIFVTNSNYDHVLLYMYVQKDGSSVKFEAVWISVLMDNMSVRFLNIYTGIIARNKAIKTKFKHSQSYDIR